MKQPHRGESFGTVFMLALTLMVLGTTVAIFPKLLGTANLHVDTSTVLSALTLHDGLPSLALSDIPISDATPIPETSPAPQQAEETIRPEATVAPTSTPVPGGPVTLTLGGSVNVEDAIRKSAYYSDSGKYDFTDIMALLRDEMESDLTMLSLENITYDGAAVSALNAPSAVMDMLAGAGVDVVALGFPKALDKGLEGLQATVEVAGSKGLATLGAYANQADADQLRMFTLDNVGVAFLHYTDTVSAAGKKILVNNGYALPMTHIDGIPDGMFADIRSARAAGADVVIVSLHWGKLSASKPTGAQKELAQLLADAGADIIVGTGSRVVQPLTWLTSRDSSGNIRQTLCAWSLGSILNESRKDGNVLGLLLQLQISFDGKSLSFEKACYTPTYIWRYKQDGQYHYRIVASDQTAPDGMSDDQIGYMEKALRNLQKYLGDSPVTLRTK